MFPKYLVVSSIADIEPKAFITTWIEMYSFIFICFHFSFYFHFIKKKTYN